MRWTTHEVEYLEEHAGDGAKSIADELGRSSAAIEMQAYRYGISLRRWWLCPRCGRRTSRPLSSHLRYSSMSARRERMAEEVRDIQEESRRIEEERRARQALYARKSRAKKRAKQMKEK